MNELVMYSNPADGIYTTPEIIAEYTNISRHAIMQLINNHKNKIEAFGVLAFEMRKPLKGSKGGRPTKQYRLNEAQATLLITLLDNTPVVAEFKTNLVKAFYEQREELTNARIMLERNHKTNKDLGETIKNCLPDNPHAFSNYHTLAYMVVTGFTPKQFREARNVTDAQDGLTANELKRMELIRGTMAGLIELGKSYQEIKAIVQ